MTSRTPAPCRGLARLERVLRRRRTRGLDREVRALEAAGTKVIRVEPGPAELAATGLDLAADVVRDRRHGGDLELTGLP